MTRAIVALALVLVAGTAQAQEASPANEAETGAEVADQEVAPDPTTEEARAFFNQGRTLADAHRYAEAAEAFSRSLSLVERPSTRFNLAVTLFAQGRHVETIAMLEAYAAQEQPEANEADRLEAARMLSLARGRVAELAFEVLPVDATVILDGQPLEGTGTRRAQVDAGVHVVRVESVGHAPELLSVEAEAGQHVRRAVELVSTEVPSTVHVSTTVPTASITVDGQPRGVGQTSLSLDAGSHTVVVEALNHDRFEQVIDVGWGQEHRIFVTPPPAASSDDSFDHAALWAGIGAGVGALALGVLVGILVSEPPAPNGGSTGVVLIPQTRAPGVVLP